MEHKKDIESRFKEAQCNYHNLKTAIEAEVVRWFWGSDKLFSLEPFYFEKSRYPKGKILKEEPAKNRQYAYLYGVNADEEIIVERQMTSFPELFYETFYFRSENEILSYRFDYGADKELTNAKKYLYENGKLLAIYSAFEDDGYWIENYSYRDGKLTQNHFTGVDTYGGAFDRTIDYAYDEIGMLDSIKEDDYYWYKKPDKKLSYRKLGELVQEKLLPLLKNTIKTHAPNEKLYCINIGYWEQNIIPPSIGFGTQSDRNQWINDDSCADNFIFWNIADYTHQVEIDCDEETAKLFDLFNQETELNGKYTNAIKIILECAKQIKQDLAQFNLDKTDDFVVVAGYFDQSDFKKNFKQLNPELMEAFKKKLP